MGQVISSQLLTLMGYTKVQCGQLRPVVKYDESHIYVQKVYTLSRAAINWLNCAEWYKRENNDRKLCVLNYLMVYFAGIHNTHTANNANLVYKR